MIEPSVAFRPTALLGLWTRSLLGFCAGVAVIDVAVEAWRYSLLRSLEADPSAVDLEQVSASDAAAQLLTSVILAALVVTGLVFLVWMHRSYSNLRRFLAAGLRFSPAWAVGGWFVPFLNLVRPMQVMNEIWLASRPGWVAGTDGWRTERRSPLVGAWWVAWVGTWVFAWIAGGAYDRARSIDQAMAATSLNGLRLVVMATAACLAIVMIGQVTDRQQRRATLMFSTSPPAGRRRGAVVPVAVSIVGFGAVAVTAILIGTGSSVSRHRETADDASSRAGELVALSDLAVGDCVHPFSRTEEWTGSLTVVDCDEPHDGEVFASVDLGWPADAAYPGQRMVSSRAERRCANEFADYAGIPYTDSRLDIYFSYPGAEGWEANERDVVCFAVDNDDPRSGSIAEGR